MQQKQRAVRHATLKIAPPLPAVSLAEIEGLALEDNVVEWALSCAKVVDKPVAFDDLMGRNAAQQ